MTYSGPDSEAREYFDLAVKAQGRLITALDALIQAGERMSPICPCCGMLKGACTKGCLWMKAFKRTDDEQG